MRYKYSRDQIFGKRLKVPKDILNLIYDNFLSFPDFIKYDLEDKIPLSCVKRNHREIVEHFGLEKAKQLDWELLNDAPSYCEYNFYDKVMSIKPEEKDVNLAIYEKLKDIVHPKDYSPRMLDIYKDRYIDPPKITNDNLRELAERFNIGECSLEELLKNWYFFKDYDCEYCLLKHRFENLKHKDILDFMEIYGEFIDEIVATNNQAYFIYAYKKYQNIDLCNKIIERTFRSELERISDSNDAEKVDLLNKVIHTFIKFSPVYKFLMNINNPELDVISKIESYLSPEHTYKYDNAREFLETYGVDNVIRFDIENDHFFSRDDCYLLENMPKKNINDYYKILGVSLSDNDSTYSIDDFYEIIKKAIIYIIPVDLRKLKGKFRSIYPDLYISASAPQELQDKFFNREFTLQDFISNPDLLDFLNKTNITYGFSEDISWLAPLFDKFDNPKSVKNDIIKVISIYFKIEDPILQNTFKEYIKDFWHSIDIEKIEYVPKLLSRLSLSNSSEMFTFRGTLATQILKSTNPIESLNKIEEVFIKNNIPTVGKLYSCFEILHPNFQGFDFEYSNISPMLKKSSTMRKKVIVFSDLIKCSFGSNNRSVNDYLKNIAIGSKLCEDIMTGYIQYDDLNDTQKKELTIFSRHLATLYTNTINKELFAATGNVLTDILDLSKKLSPDGTLDYNLGDRVIRMFCGFAGIDTLEEAKNYVKQKVRNADARNRKASDSDMKLVQGDFIKGIGDIRYLKNILQNGSVSKEYLGSSAGSDATPLDTDISMIMSSDGTINDKIIATEANAYGPIWFVLKNDERFITTRTNTDELLEVKKDISKMEVFYTGAIGKGHYGIRTGFASSEINYIIMDNYDPRVGLEIAMNGFYIPIANKEGQIIFTPNDYDKLREKMNGLSYYDENNYIFSNNLVTDETEYLASQIEQSNYETQIKRTKINEVIKESLDELGLHLKTTIDGDLTEGFVELIDTGSTGRGTNKPGDGDFDFMMRLDKAVFTNSAKMKMLKQTLLKNLGKEHSSELTSAGDFRLKNVQIDSKTSVDIDITFTGKTDKLSYSTDMALQDRLITIQRISPKKYKYVVANILLAKEVLKTAKAYKPNRGETPQGGLGGVGVENWILQNGGSFIDAARSFVEASEGKSFLEFQSSYQIWDFGDNHLAEKKGQYPHDNFVTSNMSETGYRKMIQALKEYIRNMEMTKAGTIKK